MPTRLIKSSEWATLRKLGWFRLVLPAAASSDRKAQKGRHEIMPCRSRLFYKATVEYGSNRVECAICPLPDGQGYGISGSTELNERV
jgi:hypothetical protein